MSQEYYFPTPGSEYYRPTIIPRLTPERPAPARTDAGEVTFGRILLHLLLLGLTALTTTGMGALLFFGGDTAALSGRCDRHGLL